MSDSSKNDFNKAEKLIMEGKYDPALQIVEILEKRKDLTPSERITCQIFKGNLLNKRGQYEDAIKLADQIVRESQGVKTPLQGVDALIVKIEAFYRLGKLDEGLEMIIRCEHQSKLLPQEQTSDSIQRKAILNRYKGAIYSDKGNQDLALEFLHQSMTISKERGNKREIARTLIVIGKVYWYNGELDQTLECLQQALVFLKELGDKHNAARSLANIGMIYQMKGDLEQAFEYQQQALKILEEIGNKRDIAICLGEIGNIYADKGDFKRALEYDRQCLNLFREIGNKCMIGLSLIAVGNNYMQMGELEQALEYLEPSLAYLNELDDKRGLAFAYLNMGLVYWKKGNLNAA
ncbi:MAG: tetratricopeptide repeat protein, partial [Candidatus Hodarchaeota archaeon]